MNDTRSSVEPFQTPSGSSHFLKLLGMFFISVIFFMISIAPSIAQEGAGPLSDDDEVNDNRGQPVEQGETSFPRLEAAEPQNTIDLSGKELPSLPEGAATHVLARPWYQNIEISGFGASSFLKLGAAGMMPIGGFVIKDASLFVEAEAWENISFFFELQTNVLLLDDWLSVRTGEAYAHFRNVLRSKRGDFMGVKVGRIDIPFGEEYLWTDSSDNPLISHAVGFPWLWDEGIAIYGKIRGVGWVASITDGAFARSIDDNSDKALTAKVYGTPWRPLYLSASFMRNGETARSALYWGGNCFQPMGARVHGEPVPSSAGTSPSQGVDIILYELDAKYRFKDRADVEFAFGQAFINDAIDAFDRNLAWFSVQPRYSFTRKIYGILRYSEIGTYDADKGYLLDGGFLAGGYEAFGYDTKRLQRYSLGLGWKPNPRTAFKLEVGRDRFEVIDISPFHPGKDDRDFFAAELVLSF
ncbi:hypothetical protein HYR99_15315 [Candidatus Poribacteria bacterium]|nr:hypothetical protein [Candidatus Poribacteria bacterium]